MYSIGYLIFLISLCRILIIKKVDLYLKRLQKIKCKLRLLANAPIETGRLTSFIPITRSKIFAEIKNIRFFFQQYQKITYLHPNDRIKYIKQKKHPMPTPKAYRLLGSEQRGHKHSS